MVSGLRIAAVGALLSLSITSCRLDVPNAVDYTGQIDTSTGSTGSTGPTGPTSPGSVGDPSTSASSDSGGTIDETDTDDTGPEPACGNGIVEGDETCDDQGESPTCNDDCTPASCGDGVLNATAGEACDDGGESASCNVDCTIAMCGDGIFNATANEQCDGAGRTEACNADCTLATCGDGVLNTTAGEQCDDNGESAECNVDCTDAMCGDGITNMAASEDCDDAGPSLGCDDDCTIVECGDLTINTVVGEECDDTELAGQTCVTQGFDGGMLTCDGRCTLVTDGCYTCGDGAVDPGEQCEGLDLAGQSCVTQGFDGGTLACDGACTFDTSDCYVCGDGSIDPGEQCEGLDLGGQTCVSQGFDAGLLACDGTCGFDTSGCYECGDGAVDPGEQCDDAGQSATCDVDCTLVECGDGLINVAAGEQCDDGDMVDDNLCSNACAFNECSFDSTLLPLVAHGGISCGDIEFDGDCDLLVAGCDNGALHRITPAGVVSVFVPDFGGTTYALGVAHRASDDLVYVTTDVARQLWSVSPAGVASLIMPLPVIINAIEVAPAGFGPYGDLIIGVGVDGSVHAFDPAAGSSVVLGTTTGTLSDLAFDPTTGVLYLAAYTQNAILTMDSGGTVAPFAAGFGSVDGLAIDPAGTLFAANGGNTVTSIDIGTGVQNVLANPSYNGGYYVMGLQFEAGGNLLMHVDGATIDYVTP